jgi:hypothetical protein
MGVKLNDAPVLKNQVFLVLLTVIKKTFYVLIFAKLHAIFLIRSKFTGNFQKRFLIPPYIQA